MNAIAAVALWQNQHFPFPLEGCHQVRQLNWPPICLPSVVPLRRLYEPLTLLVRRLGWRWVQMLNSVPRSLCRCLNFQDKICSQPAFFPPCFPERGFWCQCFLGKGLSIQGGCWMATVRTHMEPRCSLCCPTLHHSPSFLFVTACRSQLWPQ